MFKANPAKMRSAEEKIEKAVLSIRLAEECTLIQLSDLQTNESDSDFYGDTIWRLRKLALRLEVHIDQTADSARILQRIIEQYEHCEMKLLEKTEDLLLSDVSETPVFAGAITAEIIKLPLLLKQSQRADETMTHLFENIRSGNCLTGDSKNRDWLIYSQMTALNLALIPGCTLEICGDVPQTETKMMAAIRCVLEERLERNGK